MSNICIVASCNTRRTRNSDKSSAIKCFSFPKEPDLRRQWLHLCQVTEDYNRKVCIKHFKEDDFVDGLKARLMCIQPTRLKKDAVPSLFLSPAIPTEESKQKHIQYQEELLKKYIGKNKRKQVRLSGTKSSKVKTCNPTKRSMEYLSKLVPIAPKVQDVKKGAIALKDRLIVQKEPLLAPQWSKIAVRESLGRDQSTTKQCREDSVVTSKEAPISLNPIPSINIKLTPKTLIVASEPQNGNLKTAFVKEQIQAGLSLHEIRILQHDNAIYKKKINTLVDNQNKLLAQIKELEATQLTLKEDFLAKVKETFAHVLTSNQIDSIVGKKKHIWWSNDEYSKALKLLHISKQAYNYLRDKMNYPLPCFQNVYKWSTRHERRRSNSEKSKEESDENKENGGQYILDDDHTMMGDEVDIKYEYTENIKKHIGLEYDQDLDDKEYVINKHDVIVDQNDIECENIDQDDGHSVIVDEQPDKIEYDYYIGSDKLKLNISEHDLNEHDQIDEFYEELIIENDYSDDGMFDDLQGDNSNEKDNG